MYGYHFTFISEYQGVTWVSIEIILVRDQQEKPAVYFRGRADGSNIHPAGNMELGPNGLDGYFEFLGNNYRSIYTRELTQEECDLLYSMVGDVILPPEYDV